MKKLIEQLDRYGSEQGLAWFIVNSEEDLPEDIAVHFYRALRRIGVKVGVKSERNQDTGDVTITVTKE